MQKAIAELSTETPAERYSLDRELSIARVIYQDALELYERVANGDLSAHATVAHKMGAADFCNRSAERVDKLQTSIAKIAALNPIDAIANIQSWMMVQVAKVLQEEFGEGNAKVSSSLKKLAESALRMPMEKPKSISLVID
jgi:hypothetical protein